MLRRRLHPARLWKPALALALLALFYALALSLPQAEHLRTRIAAPSSSTLARTKPTRLQRRAPNIILVLIDDLGWADLSSYGSTFYRTPNIDALAAGGMKFTRAYAAAPVCSPSRAALLTGKSPARLHLTDWLPGREDSPAQKLLRPAIRQELPLHEVTIAERLKEAGYATASVGKWHLGGRGFAPENQGFDLNIAGDEHGGPASYFSPFKNREWALPGLRDEREGEYLTDRLTAEAENFIEQHRERPFFLYLPHYAVHIPLKAKPELVSKYQRLARPGQAQSNALYAAMIESVDESVGRIRRKLEQLDLLENTLLIFTSDNGGLSVKEGPNTPATSNAPLRDGKGYLYEGGIRVPLIFYWSRKIAPRGVCSAPINGSDLFPTLLEIAGLKSEAGKGDMDGMSLMPLLKRPSARSRRTLYWHYPHYSNQGGRPGSAIIEGDYKLIEFFEDHHTELYNLKNDMSETDNLASKQPRRAAELLMKLRAWRKRVDAQMMRPNPAYRGEAKGESR